MMIHLFLLFLLPLFIDAIPRFDPSATMQNVLIPADAAINSVIYRLRATDTTFDFPLEFILEGDNTVVSLQTLNCSRFNSVCQANVILEKKLVPGRFYDFIVATRNTKGATIRMGCSFRATNSTTPYGDIFPGAPSLLKVSESAKRNTELGTVIARGNPNRERAVLVELWGSPFFGLRQRLITEKTAEATVVLLGSLDYETQSSFHLTVLANDAWSEPGNDSRNIASWPLLIAILDEQDTPPVFTQAPPVTSLDPKLKPGDVVLQIRAEDGDRGNPRNVRYGLVSEGNPFTPFFNISDDTGELRLARPLSEIQAISHTGSPVLLTVVAEEIRERADEPPALSSSVQIALILPSPTWTSPHFSSSIFNTSLDENSAPGTALDLADAEIVGDPGEVITLELSNNNGTFDIFPTVVEGNGKFTITVRDTQLLDYESRQSVQCKILAKQLGSDNNTMSALLVVNLNDVNDNPPIFLQPSWHASIFEGSEAGMSILKVEAIDPDTKSDESVRYINLLGSGSEFFTLDRISGLILVRNSNELDAERVTKFEFVVVAADENGNGLKSNSSVIIELIDVNDETPQFEKSVYEFILARDRKSFTTPAFIKAIDLDISAPNNIIHYEFVTQAKNLTLNKNTGELLIKPIWKETEMVVVRARAWDEGVPRLWSECEIRLYPPDSRTRVITFIVPGLHPNQKAIESELRELTGAQVNVLEIHPHIEDKNGIYEDRSQVVAAVTYGPDTVIDVEKIQRIYDRKSSERIEAAGIAWPWWLLIVIVIILLLIIIILIICCICAPCPMYIPPRKRKVGSAEVSKLIIEGSGQGMNSKSVQVAEWFGRREAWTPDGGMGEAEVESLRRHEFERGSDRDIPRRLTQKEQTAKDDPREQLYIREGNADILRLITRGREQQRPITLVEQPLAADSGKEILMQRFMDQQTTSRVAAVSLPNELDRISTEHEQLEATLREQNNLLRQILLERERELRLETQSLPAGTQTDRDAFTQTDPYYLRPPQRLTRSDNDASDASDDDVTVSKKYKKHWSNRKKHNMPLRRRIRTPIQEESESNLENSEKQHMSTSTNDNMDHLKAKVLRELLHTNSSKSRSTRSAIRKEVLREIAETLIHSDESNSDVDVHTESKHGHLKYNRFSDDSLEDISLEPERGKENLSKSHKYHSESDLRIMPNENLLFNMKSISQADVRKSSKRKNKNSKKGGSRYMEWYAKSSARNGKDGSRSESPEKPRTSGVAARQVAAEAKALKRTASRISQSATQEKPGPDHPLIQHSEHRFETPVVFRRGEDDVDSGISLPRPPIAEKKSVFSIAYEDIQRQTRQLRPESSTPT